MPFFHRPGTRPRPRRWRLAALLAVATAAGLPATASAADGTVANPTGCEVDHALTKPFTAWDDLNDYALLPGGDFEAGSPRWALIGAATPSGENEPFSVGGADDRRSLRLLPGSTAISAPMCVNATYASFRFFARNSGAPGALLKVELLYLGTNGRVQRIKSADLRIASGSWELTAPLDMGLPFVDDEAGPVVFRFTPAGGDWLIDDVYVDPYARH